MSSLLILFVGSLSFAVGVALIYRHIHFLRNGEKVVGIVRAIEKQESSSSNKKGSSVTYRPVIDYTYGGKSRIVTTISSSTMRFKPQQLVYVFVSVNKVGRIKARVKDKAYFLFMLLPLIAGLIAINIYTERSEEPFYVVVLILVLMSAIAIFVSNLLVNNSTSGEDDQDLNTNSTLIKTRDEYVNEATQGQFIGVLICVCYFFIGMATLIWGFTELPIGEAERLFSSPKYFLEYINSYEIESSKMKPILILGIGLSFTFAAIFSLFFQWRKNRALAMM